MVFNEFSYITFNHITSWVSLLPNYSEKLIEMHQIVTNIVKKPSSKSYQEYDPHLTLINTKDKNYRQFSENVANSYHPISDTFSLSLGKSDDIGQFLKTVFLCKL